MWYSTPLFWILVVGGVLIAMQTYSNYLRQWYDPTWALKYQDEFDGQAMREQRAKACGSYKQTNKWTDEVEPILDFLEDLGFYLKNATMSRDVLHHHFYYWIRGYLQMTEDYRRQYQHESPLAWEHCENLLEQVSRVEADGMRKHVNELMWSANDITEFLDEEINLLS